MPAEHVQTKREIAELLEANGARPRKRLGQHFLIDGNLMRRLADSADLEPQDVVIEVGAGTGGLTDLLAARAGRVLCVEIDQDLVGILEDRFREATQVTVIRGDILESKHRIMTAVVEVIREAAGATTGSVKLVANLPYQIATPLVMNLLVDYPEVRRLCFTVQMEVGGRITAAPNTKAYGPLSIVSQALCTIQTLAKLPAQVFWPRPSVDSVMLRMDVGDPPFADREQIGGFSTLVRRTFDHRRKTLRSALGYVLDESDHARVCRTFDVSRRPESFTVPEWLEIHRVATGSTE
jgi:16S rRNA (adenine1518-N6/adenine1519-N6)-dimethyltransferase